MPDLDLLRPLLAPHHLMLADRLTSWVAATIAPLSNPHDDATARLQAREVLRLLGAAGWCRYPVPAAYGGVTDRPDLRALCLIRESLAFASPLADAVMALQGLGSLPLTLGESEEARATWLPRVATGEVMTAFAMTEAEAGSDVAGMTTTATATVDGYRLDGEKVFISNAGIADLYVVFAMFDRSRGARGIATFAVPAKTPGLSFVRAQTLAAPHPLGVIRLTNCQLPANARLDLNSVGADSRASAPRPAPAGFKLGMRTLDRLRPTVAAAACGMAARALAEAIAHVRSRRQFGQPLADFQLVQAHLATMATELAAARLLAYRAAFDADSGVERISRAAAMAKSYATEAAQRVVDTAIQLVGGRALVDDHPLDHLYRSVRALRIYEGATDIQHLVIARDLLREP